jgi:hypothetical protein
MGARLDGSGLTAQKSTAQHFFQNNQLLNRKIVIA